MNISSQNQVAQAIHAGPRRYVIAVTGGGSGAIAALLTEPGASRSILAARVPYAPQALAEFLGAAPEEACSARTARAMAMAAYRDARQLDPDADVCGLACTASLASNRPKRGPHRIHVARQTAEATLAVHLELQKGRRTRGEEEALAQALVLNAAAEASQTELRVAVPLVEGEQLETACVVAPPDQQDLLAGRAAIAPALAAAANGQPRGVFPGAFDPLHDGHRRMLAVAQKLLGHDVAFEVSIVNVDKPPLDFIEIDRRLRQFAAADALWLTRAPTFVKKAELFSGATFVVGADTIQRIGHDRYYGNHSAMLQAISNIGRRGCRFLVFGRTIDGVFRTLDDLELPEPLARLCRGVGADEFREDVSSTALRRENGADHSAGTSTR